MKEKLKMFCYNFQRKVSQGLVNRKYVTVLVIRVHLNKSLNYLIQDLGKFVLAQTYSKVTNAQRAQKILNGI